MNLGFSSSAAYQESSVHQRRWLMAFLEHTDALASLRGMVDRCHRSGPWCPARGAAAAGDPRIDVAPYSSPSLTSSSGAAFLRRHQADRGRAKLGHEPEIASSDDGALAIRDHLLHLIRDRGMLECQRDAVRLITLQLDPWLLKHLTPFNDLSPEQAASPGYRHALARQRTRLPS